MLDVRPFQIGSDFGVEIHGLRLDRDTPEETIRELIACFHKHRVVRIPAQAISLSDYERFGNWFGHPHRHVVAQGRVDGYAGMSRLTNADAERRNAAAYWHTDNSYEREPASATMLWAQVVPTRGGETMVADMVTAYDDLPNATKRLIDKMRTLNDWTKRDDGFVKKNLPNISDHARRELGINMHNLVMRHPVTGRKALYGVTGSSFGIEGMQADEGIALLKELTVHALQPKYVIKVGYKVGDIAAWDTLATLHAATPHEAPEEGEGKLREMYRINVKGVSPYALVNKAGVVG